VGSSHETSKDMSRKYEIEIDELLTELFREEWMDKEDWAQFRRTIFTKSGITYDELEASLEEGVEKGHTLKQQIIILKKQFQHLKDSEADD
jgi:uncharacterized protein YqgQ